MYIFLCKTHHFVQHAGVNQLCEKHRQEGLGRTVSKEWPTISTSLKGTPWDPRFIPGAQYACLHRKLQTLCKQWHYNRQQRHRTYGDIAEGSQNINVWLLLQISRTLKNHWSHLSSPSNQLRFQEDLSRQGSNNIQWWHSPQLYFSSPRKDWCYIYIIYIIYIAEDSPAASQRTKPARPWWPVSSWARLHSPRSPDQPQPCLWNEQWKIEAQQWS